MKQLYVDAINNEGLSGGPLVFQEFTTGKLKVAAIVSKYKTEDEPVLGRDGEDTGMTVKYNAGFLIAYSIKHALDLIKLNPAGLPVPRCLDFAS